MLTTSLSVWDRQLLACGGPFGVSISARVPVYTTLVVAEQLARAAEALDVLIRLEQRTAEDSWTGSGPLRAGLLDRRLGKTT
jgi:hypothetical protein